jgi:hypothetical protein
MASLLFIEIADGQYVGTETLNYGDLLTSRAIPSITVILAAFLEQR